MKIQPAAHLLLAAAFLAAAPPSRAGRLPRYGGDLRVQIAALPADLDPLRLAGDDGAYVASCIYEGLTRFEATDLAPALARSWVRDDDGKRWLFQLRNGVDFHDGTPCDATAVKESLRRLADPRVSAHAWLLSALVGWEDFAAGRTQDIEGLDAAPPDQIELRFASPVPDLPARLALPAAAIARRHGDGWSGTGPFLVLGASGGVLRLAASRDHADGRPFLDHVELVARSDVEKGVTREAIAMTRALVADPLPAGAVRLRVPAARLGFALVHPHSPVLDAEVREKLSLAFDRGVFVRVVLGGDGDGTEGLSPRGPKTVTARSVTELPQGDLARRPEERARILVPAGEPVLRALGERLQVHLFALGVAADLDVPNDEAFSQTLTTRAWDVVVLGWTPPQPALAALDPPTRAQHFASAMLGPILGAALPDAWSPARLGAAKDPEQALLRQDLCIPFVFYHDLWQTTADLLDFQPGTAAATLGVAGAHLEPRAP